MVDIGKEQDRARRKGWKTLEENILQPKHTPETVSAATPALCKYE